MASDIRREHFHESRIGQPSFAKSKKMFFRIPTFYLFLMF